MNTLILEYDNENLAVPDLSTSKHYLWVVSRLYQYSDKALEFWIVMEIGEYADVQN